MSAEKWRVGQHYGIHVYDGETPIATFVGPVEFAAANARTCVEAVNARGATGDFSCRVGDYLLSRFIEGSVYAAEADKRDGFLDLRDARAALAARDARITALEAELAILKGGVS